MLPYEDTDDSHLPASYDRRDPGRGAIIIGDMARRSRRSRGAVEEPAPESEDVQEQEEAQQAEDSEPEVEESERMEEDAASPARSRHDPDELKTLEFDEEISWRPGKTIGLNTLLPRLERLARELAAFDQEETDLKSIEPVARKLINRNLITHKDKGVKAYTACCLVDVLRLFVPNAPYDNDELKVTSIIRHIPGLC